jgi:hypothetical protein
MMERMQAAAIYRAASCIRNEKFEHLLSLKARLHHTYTHTHTHTERERERERERDPVTLNVCKTRSRNCPIREWSELD